MIKLLYTTILAIGFFLGDGTREKSFPLRIPPSFAGTYGELREGRFHSGMDFRVGGKVGERVYAVDDGYIYRLSVSPTGYGNGVFIKHPDGTISIYGHLNNFAPYLQKLVTTKQYELESFGVNLYFGEDEYRVCKGDYIGNVGNTGSSAAPHLHLEIIQGDGSGPLNPLRGFFVGGESPIIDNLSPVIERVSFFSIDDSTGVNKTELIASYKWSSSNVIEVGNQFYIAVAAHDKMDGTPAKLAVESYEFFLDDTSVFRFDLGEYTYPEQKTYNSLIEYSQIGKGSPQMVKSLVDPGSGFKSKIKTQNRGVISLCDDNIHRVRVEVSDLFGNKSSAHFRVKRGDRGERMSLYHKEVNEPCGNITPWFAPYAFVADGVSLSLPVMALFSNQRIEVSKVLEAGEGFYSDVWRVHEEHVPLKNIGKIKINLKNLPDSLISKAYLAKVSESGKVSYCGGRVEEGMMVGTLASFGMYGVCLDTIPPMIKMRNSLKSVRWSNQFTFTILDNISGIKDFRCEIDGKWVLAIYDKKYNKLIVPLEGEFRNYKKSHTLLLKVWDNRGNLTEYKEKFGGPN